MLRLSLFLLAIASSRAIIDCAARCPMYIRFTLMCASNGRTYTDLCRAHCVDRSLKQKFECPFPVDAEKCAADCGAAVETPDEQIAKCEARCPVYFRETLMCASDNNTYMDLCRAQCRDKSLTQKFECPFPVDAEKCAADCKKPRPIECLLPCVRPTEETYFCASNGNITNNTCSFLCQNPHLTILFYCSQPIDTQTCQAQCQAAVAPPVEECERRCPIYFREQLVCGSDGELYVDECRAQCAGKSIVQKFECPYPIDRAQCSFDCKKKAEVDKCLGSCTPDELRGPVCASNGEAYPVLCKAKCLDPSIRLSYFCPDPNDFDGCARKCRGEEDPKPPCKFFCTLEIKTTATCFSDRQLYFSPCDAKCKDESLYSLFVCPEPYDSERCAAECRAYQPLKSDPVCEERCADGLLGTWVCANDGQVYVNECRAKCQGRDVTRLFLCPYPDWTLQQCRDKCRAIPGNGKPCRANCPRYSRQRNFCASNGKVYGDECMAKCDGPFTELFQCDGQSEVGQCQKKCTCQTQCLNNRGVDCRCAPKNRKEECCNYVCNGVRVPFVHRCSVPWIGSSLEEPAK